MPVSWGWGGNSWIVHVFVIFRTSTEPPVTEHPRCTPTVSEFNRSYSPVNSPVELNGGKKISEVSSRQVERNFRGCRTRRNLSTVPLNSKTRCLLSLMLPKVRADDAAAGGGVV